MFPTGLEQRAGVSVLAEESNRIAPALPTLINEVVIGLPFIVFPGRPNRRYAGFFLSFGLTLLKRLSDMGKITGRPKKGIKQEKNIGFFVTHAQYFVIQQKAGKAGVNISDYMRQVAIFGEVRTRWTPEEREVFKKLVGISNDLQQLVTIARQEGVLATMLYFEKYRTLIDEVIKRLSDAK